MLKILLSGLMCLSRNKKREAENKISGPVLLLLDNSSAHPSADSLLQNEDIDVMFIPPNWQIYYNLWAKVL